MINFYIINCVQHQHDIFTYFIYQLQVSTNQKTPSGLYRICAIFQRIPEWKINGKMGTSILDQKHFDCFLYFRETKRIETWWLSQIYNIPGNRKVEKEDLDVMDQNLLFLVSAEVQLILLKRKCILLITCIFFYFIFSVPENPKQK